MKTENQIREDMKFLVEDAKKRSKKRPKLDRFTEAINIIKSLSADEIEIERDKLRDYKKLLEKKFDVYLANFTDFKKSDPEIHKKEVYKRYKKDYDYTALNRRIKNLDYLLNNE